MAEFCEKNNACLSLLRAGSSVRGWTTGDLQEGACTIELSVKLHGTEARNTHVVLSVDLPG
jgi:hypothetical protein